MFIHPRIYTVGIWNLNRSRFRNVKTIHRIQMAAILPKNIWNLDKKSPGFEWPAFQMVGTIATAQPFENRTIHNPIFKKSEFCMFWLQIPIVPVLLLFSPMIILLYILLKYHKIFDSLQSLYCCICFNSSELSVFPHTLCCSMYNNKLRLK